MTGLVADFLGADTEVFPGIGAVGKTGFGPPIFVPVARIGSVSVRKSEVSLGLWIVCGLVCQVDLLPVLFLHFLVDMGHVDGLFLIGRGRGKKHKEVVTLLRGSLGGGFGGEVHKIDVVDDDVGIVLLPPLFAEGAIEPSVVGGDEVAPLENFQCFLFRGSAFREQEKRTGVRAERKSAASRQFNEVTTRQPLMVLSAHVASPPF